MYAMCIFKKLCDRVFFLSPWPSLWDHWCRASSTNPVTLSDSHTAQNSWVRLSASLQSSRDPQIFSTFVCMNHRIQCKNTKRVCLTETECVWLEETQANSRSIYWSISSQPLHHWIAPTSATSCYSHIAGLKYLTSSAAMNESCSIPYSNSSEWPC